MEAHDDCLVRTGTRHNDRARVDRSHRDIAGRRAESHRRIEFQIVSPQACAQDAVVRPTGDLDLRIIARNGHGRPQRWRLNPNRVVIRRRGRRKAIENHDVGLFGLLRQRSAIGGWSQKHCGHIRIRRQQGFQ